MEFIKIKEAVARQFNKMTGYALFRTDVSKEQLCEMYLASFPEGTNPIFRERTEHDCNCCKQFIRTVGNVVALIDGKLVSIWDVEVDEPGYQVVANALSALVKSAPIVNVFLHMERVAGTNQTFEEAISGTKVWEHFFVNIPVKFVKSNDAIGPALNESRAMHDVLLRSLTEIKDNAIDMVLELIGQNSLNRGMEHKQSVTLFKKLKSVFSILADEDKDNYVWSVIGTTPAQVAKMRNTVIGTLLVDLSDDTKSIEASVESFETKVSGTNYKRTTAVATKSMIEGAKATVESMGLTSALDRRYANLSDISVNDVLYADRSAKKSMSDSVFDAIASKVADKKPFMGKVEEISIDKFISDVLPKVTSIEVMVENEHSKNLVSMVAPVDPTAGKLFKWDNNFSWSYNGDVADSIKDRVKKAGGSVEGDLCCRLAWFNHDDLDINMTEPGGDRISYSRKGPSRCGGQLDIDMNAGSVLTHNAVENIFYRDRGTMQEGVYTLCVNNYRKRENIDVGFEVEIDVMGTVHRFVYSKAVPDKATIIVAEITYSKIHGFKIISSLPSTQASKNVWGLQTGNFHKVNVMTLSPNYWSERGVGNKHFFLMLDGCINEGTARGFYNEFLRSDLDVHRKVFEMVGSKMHTAESANQLSGLGFPSTQRGSIICRVSGSFTRVLKVLF